MVQLLMPALHKYLNEKPSMCDLQFYTDGVHTQRTFCSYTAYLGLWPGTPEMSKGFLWTFYFLHFLFYLGTMFFSSEVTVLSLVNYAQCHLCLLKKTLNNLSVAVVLVIYLQLSMAPKGT